MDFNPPKSISAAGQNPVLFDMFDWKEVFTTYIEGLGWDNTDKFFKDDTPAQQFSDQLKQIPPDLQNQVVGYFQQQLQQMAQQYQQNQRMQEMQNQANNQVQMDMMRQQARQNAEQQLLNQLI